MCLYSATYTQPLSTDELVRHLNDLKKRKKTKGSHSLPQGPKPTHLDVNTSVASYASDYTADSSDLDQSYPPSPNISPSTSPKRRHRVVSSDSQEMAILTGALMSDSQQDSVYTTTTTTTGSLQTDNDSAHNGDLHFPTVSRTSSSDSVTGTTTASEHDRDTPAEEDSAGHRTCKTQLSKSPSLLRLQHDSEAEGEASGRLRNGSEESGSSFLQWFHPSHWISGKVIGNVRLWLCSPSNVINFIIVIA